MASHHRLASGVLVSGLIRRAASEGGSAAVLARGDVDAGGILLLWCNRGCPAQMFEASSDSAGRRCWRPVFAELAVASAGGRALGRAMDGESESRFTAHIERQRRADPDLWVVELDIAKDQRFAEDWLAKG